MKRLFALYFILITSTLVLTCGGDDPVSPEESIESLSSESYFMVSGPRKYMVLLNTLYAENEWSNFVCALEPNPKEGEPGVIESTANLHDELFYLKASGLVGNAIYGLEPSSKYYCRAFTRFASGTSYSPNYVFDTGPDFGTRLVKTTEPINDFTFHNYYYYDTLGVVKFQFNVAEGPVDPQFGSLSYAYVFVYDDEGDQVIERGGEMRSARGWDISFPVDYATRILKYENNELITDKSLSSNKGKTYFREGDRVTIVTDEGVFPDSVVHEYFFDEGYSVVNRFVKQNGQYAYSYTKRYDYDLTKQNPFYDLLNKQMGYGNFPLAISFEQDFADGTEKNRTFDYSYNGPFPVSDGSKSFYYTEFD